MTQPLHLSEQAWQDAESLVERIEASARTTPAAATFYDELVSGLRFVCGAATATLTLLERDHRTDLARSGMVLHSETRSSDRSRVTANHSLHEQTALQLEIRFDQPVALTTEEHLQDLAAVLLAQAASVYLRQEFSSLRKRLTDQSNRDTFIGELNEGVTLEESFTAIATTIATRTSADRVSLLRLDHHRAKLLATSTQPRVDRRGSVARSLQRLAVTASERDSLAWTRDSDLPSDSMLLDSIEDHVQQTDCSEFFLRTVRDAGGQPIAAVVLERLRPTSDIDASLAAQWDLIDKPVEAAIGRAVRRDRGGWSRMFGRLSADPKRTAIGACVVAVAALMLALIPTTLKIPAEGRVVASQRGRLFAPTEGLVSELLIENHQFVQQGEPLIRMASPTLDQARAEIEGKLATARTQLDALLATRPSSASAAARNGTTSITADRRILETEIKGLENQLTLMANQHAQLIVTSPIDGKVDGWNLRQSLSGRPVSAGQHLLDVIDPEGGYHVELQLPDRLSGYVFDSSRPGGRQVSLRLRSDPTVTYKGVIQKVAATAQRDSNGESNIRMTVELLESPDQPLRHGATVVAQIDGPRKPLGFVWLRRVLEWSREQIWL